MIAVLSSLTTASRIKRYMEMHGTTVRVIQTPKELAHGGCGYSVSFQEQYQEEISNAARQFGASVRGFYQEERDEDGKHYRAVRAKGEEHR